MNLQYLLFRTELTVRGAIEFAFGPWRSRYAPARPPRELELSDLEDRVLLSAVPAAMMAQPADVAPVDTTDQAQTLDPTAGDLDQANAADSETGSTDVAEVARLRDGEHDRPNSGESGYQENTANAGIHQPQPDLQSGSPLSALDSRLSTRHELVFVDTSVRDYQQLLDDLWSHQDPGRQLDVVLLSGSHDGIDQIGETLARHRDLDAMHIVSHGTAGAVKLGSTWLNLDNVGGYAGQLVAWRDALASDADLMIYGCDLAVSDDGQLLIESLAALTAADVVASTDDTGHTILGGDWELECTRGDIEFALVSSIDVQPPREIALVDTQVAEYQRLVDDLKIQSGAERQIEIFLLDAGRDGILQISETLSHYENLGTVHIVSHGTDGGVKLGNTWLRADTLAGYAGQIATWGNSLDSEADLLFYGCDLAAGDDGKFLVDSLGVLTGAAVAASTDATGHALLGGDWDLEYATGDTVALSALDAAQPSAWWGLLEYNESASSWSPTSAGSWEVKDLSGGPYNIPANAVLEIAATHVNDTAGETMGVRAVGSALERKFLPQKAKDGGENVVVMHVQADASSRIETYASDITNVSFTLLGYWDDGVYEETFGSFTTSADATWEDQSLSSYGVGPGDVAEVVIDKSAEDDPLQAGVRTDGSSLERRVNLTVLENNPGGNVAASMFVQADVTAGAVVEAYAEQSTGADFYIVGYWSSAPGTYHETMADIGSPSASVTWEDGDLSAFGVGQNDVAEVLLTNDQEIDPNQIGVRGNGSAAARLLDLKASDTAGSNPGRMHVTADADATIEFYQQDVADAHSFFLTGYWSLNAPPATTNLAGDSLAYTEGQGAVVIEQGGDAVVSDVDSVNFDTGNLTVSIAAGGDAAEDVLSVRDEGLLPGQIGFDGTNITYGGVLVGTAAGGSGGADLVVTLNVSATPTAITALVKNITYENIDAVNPTEGARVVRFTIADGDGGTSTDYDATVTVSAASIWFSQEASDAEPPFTDATHVYNFFPTSLEDPNTAGSLSATNFDMDNFGATTVEVNALHYVTGPITLSGVGLNTVSLNAGDVIFTIDENRNLTSMNSLSVERDDLAVFQPQVVGDYSVGTFTMLANEFGANSNVTAFTLIEQDTVVPGTGTLARGSFLYVLNDGSAAREIMHYDPATGASQMVVDGTTSLPGFAPGANIVEGIDLVEGALTIGGRTLTSGQILVTLSNDDDGLGQGVGTNDLAVADEDIFVLTLTNSTTYTADLLFDGSDISFTGDVRGLTLVNSANDPPTLGLPGGALNYTENDPATVIDPGATVSDPDSTDFDTGTLTVDFTAGGTANDRLAIRNQGTGLGQIGVSGSDVTYEGTTIGTFAGGSDGFTPLVVTLNANADQTAAQALLRNVTYENLSEDPATAARSVQFVLTDGDGATSNAETKTINVTRVNDAPLLDNAGNMQLNPVAKDDSNPPGNTVAEIVASAGGDRISDADSGAVEGIAVTGVDDSNGQWQYDAGSGWTAFGVVDDSSAVLLDVAAKIRFVPDAGYAGTAGNLTFRAWDQTDANPSGTTGVNVSVNGGVTAYSAATETVSLNVITDAGVLWLTTDGDASSSGVPGLGSWDSGDLLQQGNPNLSLEPTTTEGTFSIAFNIDLFASGADTNAVHYVTRNITVGSAHAIDLLPGDLLLSTKSSGTALTSGSTPVYPGFTNSLTVNKEDVFVFRPDAAGDYLAGTFAMLLENPLGNDVRAISLIEQDTIVGDTTLTAGDFLIVAGGGAFDSNVGVYETLDVGAGTTNGTYQTLLDGSDPNVAIATQIWSADLVEQTVTIGGRTLNAGSLLLSVNSGDNVGKFGLTVSEFDLFAFDVAKTTLVAGLGNGEATASLVFEGGDVNFDGGPERLDGFTIVTTNTAPTLSDTAAVLNPVAEDAGPPSGIVGSLISELADLTPPTGGQDNVTDVDEGAVTGLAIVGADTSNGTWHYSIDGGANWNPLGPVSDVSARLLAADADTRVYFEPNPNYNGTVATALTFRAWDQTDGYLNGTGGIDVSSNGGTTAYSGATDAASITVTPVNDAPVLSGIEAAPLAYTEDDPPTAVTGTLAMTDVDDLEIESAVVQITANYASGEDLLAFADTPGITGSWDTGSGRLTLTGSDTLSNYIAALRSVTYENTSDTPNTAPRSVSFTVNDGDTDSNTLARTINITPLNDAPTTSNLAGDFVTYVTGSGPQLVELGGDTLVDDVDSADFAGGNLTVSITAGNDPIEDVLSIRNEGAGAGQIGFDGLNVTYSGVAIGTAAGGGSGADLVVTLNANATPLAVGALVRNITYENTDLVTPTLGARTLRFTIDDGDGGVSADYDTTLNVTLTAPPTIANLAGDSLAYSEGDGPRIVEQGGDVLVSDADSTDFDTGNLTVSIAAGGDAAEDVLSIRDEGSAPGQIGFDGFNVTYGGVAIGTASGGTGGADLVVALNANATPAAATALVRNITYENLDTDNPTIGARTVRFRVNDGDGGTSPAFDAAVTVSRVNDAPLLAGIEGSPLSYTEDDVATPVTTSIGLTDVDDTQIESATIRFSAGYASGEDVLAFVDTASITGTWDPVTGTLTLTGADSLGAYQAALRSVTYENTSEAPSGATRTVSFRVHDGNANSNTLTRDITVTPVNDAPVLDLDANNSSGASGADFANTFTEDGGPVAAADVDATLTDPENTNLQSVIVTITNLLDNPAEFLSADTSGTGITATYDALTGVLTLSGSDTVANYQQVLRTIEYNNISQNPNTTDRVLQVRANDGTDDSNLGTVTMAVNAANDDPVITSNGGGPTAGVVVAENTTAVTNVTATDIDTDTPAFAITGGDDQLRFHIDNVTGVLTFATAPDFETPADAGANNVYEVEVTASDGNGGSDTQLISVTVIDTNDNAPVITPGQSFGVAEDAANGTSVGTVFATDVDTVGSLQNWTIVAGDPDGVFAIDPLSGELTIADNTNLDFETTPSYTLMLTVGDGINTSAPQTVTINVTDMGEWSVGPISDTDGAPDSIAENALPGAAVGITAWADDPDVMDTVTYSLDNDASGRFTIDLNSGVITLAGLLDYETDTSHTVTVRATSSDTSTVTRDFTVSVTDVNDTPPVITPGQSLNVAEDAGNGTSLGNVVATDPDTIGSLQDWTIAGGNTDGVFAIDPATGEITVADNTNLDFETTPGYTLILTVSDGLNTSSAVAVSVTVDNVNEAPVSGVPGPQVTAEDTPLVFSLSGGNPITISDVDAGPNPLIVTLTATNGTLTLGTTVGLTFGTGDGVNDVTMTFVGSLSEVNAALEGLKFTPAANYHGGATLQITVDDQGHTGLGGPKTDLDTVNITVTPVNDAPEIDDQAFSVAEHSSNGTLVGTAVASDPDVADTPAFSIVGGDPGGVFSIDPVSGEVLVADSVALVYETNSSFSIVVEASDGHGGTDTAVITINLINIDTPPVAVADHYGVDAVQTLTVAASGVLANDTDIDGDAISAVLVTGPVHGVLSLAGDGSFTYTPDDGFVGADSFTYRPTDGLEAGAAVTVTIDVRPTAPPPDSDPGGDPDDRDEAPEDDDDDELDLDVDPAPLPTVDVEPDSGTNRPSKDVRQPGDQPVAAIVPGVSVNAEPGTVEETVFYDHVSTGDDVSHPVADRDESRSDGDDTTPEQSASTSVLNTALLWQQLDTLQEDMLHDVESEEFIHNLVVGSSAVGITSLTVGYVIWLIRGGTLLATMISSLPAWMSFDPLPVLDSFEDSHENNKRKHDEDDINFESLVT